MNERRILINGASGRIGRSVTYELNRYDLQSSTFEVVALNDPVGIDKIIESLSGHDPVHGKYNWKIDKVDDHNIRISGRQVAVFAEKDISKIPFGKLGVKIVEECSGFYGDDKKVPGRVIARDFLQYGCIDRVILSYPAENADITMIMGVNHDNYNLKKHNIISNSSCTTKSVAEPLRTLVDNGLSIDVLFLDTVHAATNSQPILESLDTISTHKTGAAKSLGLVIPELIGKMDGLSYRVPTLDGSIANVYFVAGFEGDLDAKIVNEMLRTRTIINSQSRMAVLDSPEVSTKRDIIGRTENSLIVASKTRVLPIRKHQYMVWLACGYDNERGPPMDQTLLTMHTLVSRS